MKILYPEELSSEVSKPSTTKKISTNEGKPVSSLLVPNHSTSKALCHVNKEILHFIGVGIDVSFIESHHEDGTHIREKVLQVQDIYNNGAQDGNILLILASKSGLIIDELEGTKAKVLVNDIDITRNGILLLDLYDLKVIEVSVSWSETGTWEFKWENPRYF